jgi:prepilin-type N-terminal cleavage/methylation domain-containing protein
MTEKYHSEVGYTLMELLCTFAIIGILAGLYLGVIARAFIYIVKFLNQFSGH